MAALGNLEVRLSANIARFEGALNRAEQLTAKRSQNMKRSFLSVGKSIAVLAGSAGFGMLVKSSLNSADAIAKLSKQTGFAVESIQRLGFAFGQSGVNQTQFNTGLTAFAKRLGELKAGTGSLLTFLNKYDKNLVSLLRNTDNTEQAFRILAKSFAKIKDEGEAAALGSAAFSRASGPAMAAALRQGIDSLDDLGNKLNNVFTAEQAAQAERANDAWDLLKTTFGNLVDQIAISLAGPLASLAEWFTDIIPIIGRGAEAFSQWIGLMEKSNTQKLQDELSALREEQDRLLKAQDNWIKALQKAGTETEIYEKGLEKIREKLNTNNEQIRDIGKQLQNQNTITQDSTKSTEQFAASIDKSNENINKIKNTVSASTDKFDSWAKSIETDAQELEFLNKQLDFLGEMFAKGQISMERYLEIEKQLIRTTEELGQTSKKTAETISKETTDALEKVDDKMEESRRVWEGVFEDFGGSVFESWVGFWEDALNGSIDSFKDFTKAVFDQFKAMLARLIALWTSSKIFQFLGIGTGVAGLGSIGSIFSGGIGNIAGSVGGLGGIGKSIGGLFGLGAGATVTSGAGGALALSSGFAGAAGSPVALAGPGGFAQLSGIGAGGAGGGFGLGGLANPAIWGPAAGFGAIFGLHALGRSNRPSRADIRGRLGFSSPFESLGGGAFGAGIRGLDGPKDYAKSLKGITEVDLKKYFDGVNIVVERFGDELLISNKHYDVLKQAIQDSEGTIVGTFENFEQRAKTAFGRLSQEAQKRLANIDQNADDVVNVFKDGIVTAVEAAELGIEGMGSTTVAVFQQMIGMAQAAASAARGIGDISVPKIRTSNEYIRTVQSGSSGGGGYLGDMAAGLLPIPRIARESDYGYLGAQHGGTFTVQGRGGVDANNLRVSSGERLTVETPGQAGKQIELLSSILLQLKRQGSDMARLMAK